MSTVDVTCCRKSRVVPEVGSYVVGELRWGHAVLAYGKAGHWLLIAFEKRDNAWILAKAPTRDFLQQVTSTVDISDLDDGVVSPQEVEPGACEEITAKAQRGQRLDLVRDRALGLG